jgi:hypothetical protein
MIARLSKIENRKSKILIGVTKKPLLESSGLYAFEKTGIGYFVLVVSEDF